MNSETHKTMSAPGQLQDRHFQTYKPSYIDRFMEAVLRLPVPYWVTYLSLFTLQSLLFHILSWADGWVPPYTFNPILLLFPQWLWGPLLIMTYLNKVSLKALSSFSPLLNVREKTMGWCPSRLFKRTLRFSNKILAFMTGNLPPGRCAHG